MPVDFAIPFQLGPMAVVFLAVVIFASAFIRGYSGFGFSALVVSGSALITDPLYMVPVVMILEIVATLGQARSTWPDLDRRMLLIMLAGALITMPLSVTILSRLDIDTVRLVLSSFILAMSIALLAGWSLKKRVGAPGMLGAGMASGIANAAAVGGLPIALFLAAQSIPARIFRATMMFYLCAIDIFALPMMVVAGIASTDTVVAAVLALPFLFAGIWLGSKRFLHTQPADFRRMTIILLAVMAILGLIKSLV